ncbi:unnamed protein product [Sphenostylis stenocarpa]|uniref:Uncharacterized protein n=1 Tax=Sphenostylis stenocarpa TaxID=92480 RepID=A0AA86TAC3_9FABA|nr:unnamed protein product [Sphenostylis stenocarpa]CAJ1974984.1 unnamed protein product [Sphenostylis stenocarpa]
MKSLRVRDRMRLELGVARFGNNAQLERGNFKLPQVATARFFTTLLSPNQCLVKDESA